MVRGCRHGGFRGSRGGRETGREKVVERSLSHERTDPFVVGNGADLPVGTAAESLAGRYRRLHRRSDNTGGLDHAQHTFRAADHLRESTHGLVAADARPDLVLPGAGPLDHVGPVQVHGGCRRDDVQGVGGVDRGLRIFRQQVVGGLRPLLPRRRLVITDQRYARFPEHEPALGCVRNEEVNAPVHLHAHGLAPVHRRVGVEGDWQHQRDLHHRLAGRGQVLHADPRQLACLVVGRGRAVDQPILAVLVRGFTKRGSGVLR